MAVVASESTCISSLLHDIDLFLDFLSTLFCKNLTALHLITNTVFFSNQTCEKDYHFVCEKVTNETLITSMQQPPINWPISSRRLYPNHLLQASEPSLVFKLTHTYASRGVIRKVQKKEKKMKEVQEDTNHEICTLSVIISVFPFYCFLSL